MNDNKKYSIAILIGFVVIALFTVTWGLFLNFGTLEVTGKAPFTVDVMAGPSVDCDNDTCKVEVKPGSHIVRLYKNGYLDQKQEIDVKRWKTAELKVDFKFIPKVKEVSNEAEKITTKVSEIKENFSLANQDNGQQALILTENGKVIAYFSKSLDDAVLYISPNEKSVAIKSNSSQGNDIYLVDVNAQSRTNIFSTKKEIQFIQFSPESQNLIVKVEEKTYVIDQKGNQTAIDFDVEGSAVSWFDEKKIVFASDTLITSDLTSVATENTSNEFTIENYINLLNEGETELQVNDSKTVFIYLYDLEKKEATRLVTLQGSDNLPVKIEVNNVGIDKEIFFYDSVDKKYQVVFEPKD